MKTVIIKNFKGKTVGNVRLDNLTEKNRKNLLEGKMLKNVEIYIEVDEFKVKDTGK